jgi:hypothetical protein
LCGRGGRRQKRLDAQLQKEREKIEKGLARSGFLVAYYMYNHDGDAAREGFLWRPPKARPLIPYGKGSVRSELCACVCADVSLPASAFCVALAPPRTTLKCDV